MTFQLYGIIPIPAWLVVSGIFAYDSYNTLKDTVSREPIGLSRDTHKFSCTEWHNRFRRSYRRATSRRWLFPSSSLPHILTEPTLTNSPLS